MILSTLLQIGASCLGIIDSLFFAIGVIRQNTDTMAKISETYWDSNPHMVPQLAAQKADYIFGGLIIVSAFIAQLSSFLVPPDFIVFSEDIASKIPWFALVAAIFLFFSLLQASRMLRKRFERQIEDALFIRAKQAVSPKKNQ